MAAKRSMVGVIQAGGAYVTPDAVAAQAMCRAIDAGARPRAPEKRSLGHVIHDLHEAGRLRDEQLRAAEDIEAYAAGWVLPLGAGRLHDRVDGGGGAAAMEPPSVRLRAVRYRSWAGWAEAQPVRGDLRLLQVTLDVCLRGWTPWHLRQVYRISDVRALRLIQASLLEYAVRAGWVDAARAA
ncbi:hypothetical protein [Falsiroseomonas selenitidurans]|uniref:Uncharacterized protein n=1 Tax=Falsiroseomonas selenitidurans TaxID=2716335 RepID=A0ABX1ECJ7_9PROT|nr:hypothetical protein [Falsiroseomonas selenitidurans]NKC33488.1 hypothetical protein [Falsiroseomonas selenitidurans]